MPPVSRRSRVSAASLTSAARSGEYPSFMSGPDPACQPEMRRR
jgi:hypothetical protein